MRGIENLEKDTQVTFPGNEMMGESKVIAVKALEDNQVIVFVETTPFHPVDHLWPDQPADKGHIVLNKVQYGLINCVTAAFCLETQELLIDKEIKEAKIRRAQTGWIWLVGHIIHADETIFLELFDKAVKLMVDSEYREALSQAHTVCHLAALFLNKILSDLQVWKKPHDQQDSLGNPDFDKLTLTASKIEENTSIDEYRVGKSLRAKINIKLIIESLEVIQYQMQDSLNQWISSDTPASLEPRISDLSAVRIWKTNINNREASIPCGGTHIAFFDRAARIETTLNIIDNDSFKMINRIQVNA